MSSVTKNKLESILKSGFDSPDFRRALDSVATFYGESETLDKVNVEGQDNDGENTGSGDDDYLDDFGEDENGNGLIKNTIEARRNLHDNLQAHGLKNIEEFLKQFEGLKHRWDAVVETVNSLDDSCKNIEEQLAHAESATSVFIKESQKLNEDKEELLNRQQLVEGFLSDFQLSREELQLLRHKPLRGSDGGAKFFETVEKLKNIRSNSSAILGSNFQRASLETLEEVTSVQEAVYARLYEWVKEYCEKLGNSDKHVSSASEVDPQGMVITKRALKVLQDRPEYYNDCVEIVVDARQAALRKRFIVALTRGTSGQNGISRPIELHAHDVFRYLSDMLAWVHVSIATETDVLTTLFDNASSDDLSAENKKIDNDNTAGMNDITNDVEKVETIMHSHKTALSSIFSGLARPLTSRVIQSINQTHDIVKIFQLIDVLSFYLHTIRELLVSSCKFVEGLENCSVKAQKHFRVALDKYANDLRENLPSFATSLSVMPSIVEASSKVKKICGIYNQSIVPEDVKNSIFFDVLTSMIEPMRHTCTVGSQHLDDVDTAVFLINNLNVIRLSIASYVFAKKWRDAIDQQIVSWMETLVIYQVKACLQQCDLIQILQIVKDMEATVATMAKAGIASDGKTTRNSLSSMEGMDCESVNEKILKFNEELAALDLVHLEKIDDSNLRMKTMGMVTKELYEAYQIIFNACSKDGGYNGFIGGWYTLEKAKIVMGRG